MKRIICILLCLMMVLPAAVSLANDGTDSATPITSISVTVTPPVAGTTTATKAKVAIPSGSHYTIIELDWLNDNLYIYHDEVEDITFEVGKVYKLGIVLRAESGYAFQSPTLHIAGASLYSSFAGSTQGDEFVFIVNVTAQPAENVCLSKPKSVKLTAVSAKKIKVSWKKLSAKDKKKIRKFEIQVSTDKQFTKIVKKKMLSSGKTSWTISGLKKNTKYWVRIRAYTKSGNELKVSKWVVKSKKTKKK